MPARQNSQNKKAYKSIRHIKVNTLEGVDVGLGKLGHALTKEVRWQMINGVKSGAYYRYKGQAVRASARGEAPAVRSAKLLRDVKAVKRDKKTLIFGNPTVIYALFLNTTLDRPYLKQAIDKLVPAFRQRILNEITKRLSKGGK